MKKTNVITAISTKSTDKRCENIDNNWSHRMKDPKYRNKRCNSLDIRNYVISNLPKELEKMGLSNQGLVIKIKANMKLKVSSASLRKESDGSYLISFSTIQIDYSSLHDAMLLSAKLLKAHVIGVPYKGTQVKRLLKFPSGDQTKPTKEIDRYFWEVLKIKRFDGFSNAVACTTEHVCSSCGYNYKSINMPKPESPYQCEKCNALMVSYRHNYNYRDNLYHWGTKNMEQLIKVIDPSSSNFTTLSKNVKVAVLKHHSRSFSHLNKETELGLNEK